MASIRDHYETLLARHYTAMHGGFEPAVEREAARFEALGVARTGRALDLGCGSGFQSVALARRGLTVTAIDLSPTLLEELETHADGLAINTLEGDFLEAARLVGPDARPFDLVTCMGDTLPSLASHEDVARLCREMARLLAPDGVVVLTFRDLTSAREGLERFLPVRLNDDLLMTCFLEYEADAVTVNDLVHVREKDGWQFAASAYRKLRLAPAYVRAALETADLKVSDERLENGLVTLVARQTL